MQVIVLFLFSLFFVSLSYAQPPYPVPLPPGGRNSVHGWLILPVDQEAPVDDPTQPVEAYFVHHTPEFWTDSPHNFQIILYGTLVPFETANNVTEYIPIPYPPASPLLIDEFTITPPGPFSLNDLLSLRITELYGVVYNGSFDTPYERYAIAMSTLYIKDLTTAVYLNISSDIVAFSNQQYYSYPRGVDSSETHLYLCHQIHAAPDFDQVIHVSISSDACICTGSTCGATEIEMIPGLVWEFQGIPNDLDNRLMPSDNLVVGNATWNGSSMSCKMLVLEQIHCVVGPAFADICG